MSDDLIERLRRLAGARPYIKDPLDDAALEAADEIKALRARIRELESANYRLTEERDRLKGWADKYHDEVLVLRARLATAQADAMERSARVLARASEEIRALKPKADE